MPNLDSDDYKRVKEQALKRYYRDELGRPDWEQRVRKRDLYVRCFMKQIRRQVKLQGRSILDVGSGWGDFLCFASRYAAFCVGVEPDIERIAISKTSLRQSKRDAYLVRAVGEYLPFRCGTFDFVSCMSVLEHANDPVSVLKEIVRVTKSGGMCHISFPNYMFPLEPHYNLVWLPFMPRGLAHKYLRIRGRNPRFIDSINYVTPFLVGRTLRRLGIKIRNLLLDGSLTNDDFPNRSVLKRLALNIQRKIGNTIVGRSLAYFSPSWAIMFFKPNPSELRQTGSLERRGGQK